MTGQDVDPCRQAFLRIAPLPLNFHSDAEAVVETQVLRARLSSACRLISRSHAGL
ncbi:hypothetical protein [Streptomyces sp. NPDC088816]|uniref:hypothetical protein n=1 Tax=Streptomyces sp. NPDC088816 TaxID=3365906 RepID=UPI0037F26E04